MPPLSVSGGKTSIALAPKPRFPLPLVLGFFGLLGTASGLWLMLQKRLRWALALVIAGLLVSGVSFASAASRPAEPNPPTISNQTPQEIGKSLFLAKGCVTCHAHEEIKRDTNRTIFVEIGPDLTNFSADPEYLRRWLTNPAAIRPNTEMPNLQLSESEIDALIAFLNAE